MSIELVWLKKDLRFTDHQPLFKATQNKKALALYIFEDELKKQPENSDKHKQFITSSLIDLKEKLSDAKIPFLICEGDILTTLSKLHKKFRISKIHSHEETGTYWTYERDLKVKVFCIDNSIEWNEYKQFAVVRGPLNRDHWNTQRNKHIDRKEHTSNYPAQTKVDLTGFNNIDPNEYLQEHSPHLQTGGAKKANSILNSFFSTRFNKYQKSMSSPNNAWNHCSRLSPYITWGNISMTQVNNALKKKTRKLISEPSSSYKLRNLKSFDSRLWWHCHFIQKMETEPEIEFRNFNPGFDELRSDSFDQEKFEAWQKGETGYPIIDACMRALHKHGWINFRMRAMLISFASYHLWLHWEKPAWHLARLFTDFEPGIHFSQIQMQSGTTGINSIRIYSPLKQSVDQDPEGLFIRKFVPELANVDPLYIHQPELMPPLIQQISGCVIGRDYPNPIVDHKKAYNFAKENIFAQKNKIQTRKISKKVYNKHGSRKNKHFPTQTRDQ